MPSTTTVDPAVRRARVGVALLFLTNGALFANILPRYPEIKEQLGLDAASYGLAIAAFPAGAMVAGLGAAVLIRRFGSAEVAVVGTRLSRCGIVRDPRARSADTERHGSAPPLVVTY